MGMGGEGGKTALTKGFCDALAAFRCFDGKCAVVDYSIREAATRKGLISADQNLDYESFDGEMAPQK